MLALLLAATLPARSDGTAVPHADALRQLLTSGNVVATLQQATIERGCGLHGCVIQVAGLTIQREKGEIHNALGQPVLVHNFQSGAALLTIDWELLGAWRVLRQGKQWGSCLEFTHTGIGKSGPYQRWTSVVLIPWTGVQPARVAQRIVAYLGSCDALAVGEAVDEVILPVVQPMAGDSTRLQIAKFRCNSAECKSFVDIRQVRTDPAKKDGSLLVHAP